MAITFERDDNNPEAAAAIKPAGRTGWIETTAAGEWTGKFSPTKPSGAGANWREVGYATVTLNDGRQFRAVLDESGKPISVIGDTIGEDPDQTKRWKDRQAAANDAPTERNNNGRRERWNGRANGGQGAWEDVGPAINTGNATTPRTPEQQAQDAAQAQAAQIAAQRAQADKDEEDWNANPANIPYGASGRRETHRARDERLAKEQKEKQEAAERAAERNRPTSKQETVRGSDGKDYTRVSIIDPTTKAVTIKNFGPDGKEVSEIPGEGPSRPTVAGPPLPQIVLGASQDAARTYKEQLQEGVAAGRWSQAWADSRWKEFMEVANLAVSEAATRQRNEESQRNAEFNIANARMGSMNTATSNALTFVNSINGLLPAGSNLGGQAFAALLGLNMLQSQMSGMNRIDPRRQPPQLTPAEISNPAALQARREQVQTQVQQAAAPPVRDDYRTNPGQPAAPAPAPAPVAPAPQPLSPGQAGMMSPVPDAENPPVPQSPGMPGMMSPVMDAENPPVAPATGDPFVGGRVMPQPEPAAPAVEVPPLETPPPWSADPNAAPSGGAFPPLPIVPRAGTEAGGNVQKVMPNPAGEWAALAPLAPMPMQQPAMAGAAQMGEPVAARRARIASSPPWRLSPEDIDWAEQNGFGQEAWRVPGRVA